MVRRRVAAGVGVALVIIIALVVNGCLKSKANAALETYSQNVGQLVKESEEQVSHPLFETLSGAAGKSAFDVENEINQLRLLAQNQARHAKELSAPGAMGGAQRAFLLAMDLRAEGLAKIAGLVRAALGGQSSNATTQIAGDMEIFLASDVIYSQRVAPLIQQTLTANGITITEQIPSSTRFLPNLGWLESSTVQARLAGQSSSSSSSGTLAPGTHGHKLAGVSVNSTNLEPEPTLNHVKAGTNPTFTVQVNNAGENTETNVKVEVTVESQGKQHKGSYTIQKTEPGKTVPVDIPVEGVSLGPAKILVNIEKVPGETELENNKATYLAIFE
jgi:hypothetical protein